MYVAVGKDVNVLDLKMGFLQLLLLSLFVQQSSRASIDLRSNSNRINVFCR